ncbi:hypothetical protein D3C73_1222560 [compost metagenome]
MQIHEYEIERMVACCFNRLFAVGNGGDPMPQFFQHFSHYQLVDGIVFGEQNVNLSGIMKHLLINMFPGML